MTLYTFMAAWLVIVMCGTLVMVVWEMLGY
jgi:hypothetical protein